ncbi:DUF72 domain-containing protein [Cognatilysobacter lacus]|uniref:DUF72 domain-containing protein n=1 Tax=Cognatilysobacter lacus TaxID=1643323 RepID=A0A5D8YYY9_9GAMM|nr:DUF72 domain-containing protein [Lysobacter lacus]TZF87701.1 DUF72 domain-containing protein [Lysobacter lacus]
MTISGDFHIGCAGWSIPGRQAAQFPGEGTHLERYASRFIAVEINSSFYRPHQSRTYAKWAGQVPDGFRFAVKFPRAVTHLSRLREPAAVIDEFAGQVDGLGDRLGPVLVQLPPSLAFEPQIAGEFFARLRERIDGAVVCEPRHASWFTDELDDFWKRYQVGRVAADPARVPEAAIAAGAGPVRYWRLHGSPRVYYDAYGEGRLQAWAAAMRDASDAGSNVWVVMDNTAMGHATDDALQLEAMLPGGRTPA